jgi:hypothetical protein
MNRGGDHAVRRRLPTKTPDHPAFFYARLAP